MDSKDRQQKDEGGKTFGTMPIAQDNSNKPIDLLRAAPGPVIPQNMENFPSVVDDVDGQQKKDEDGKTFGIMPIAQDNSNKAIDVLKAAPGPVQIQNTRNFPGVEGTKEEREARKAELNKKH